MTTVFCDTSVLIRYFAEDDIPRAAAAAALFDSDVELVISTGVILEAIHVLRTHYGFDNPILGDLLTRLLLRERIQVSDADKAGLLGALSWSRGSSARRIADALIATTAEQAGVDFIATFDEKVESPSVPVRLL